MASEKDFEILDEYAGNRLNPEDKAAFEQQLESDAELKNELTLQRKIIEGIRSSRKAELKKMLNDVPLSSIPSEGMSTVAKISLWVVIAGLASTGLYFYFNQEDETSGQPVITNEIKDKESNEVVADESKSAEEVTTEEQPATENSTKAEAPVAEKQKTKTPTQAASKPEVVEEKAVEPSTLDVFDPSADAENGDEIAADENGPRVSTKSSMVVETELDKRYNFHYQFRDNKLFLYGSFEKNFYEIMEFFSNNKRTMFLFYKDNYYLLNEGDNKVKPLVPINDTVLLKKLKDSRGN